jgi:2-C-methyl-D-erythritol 4-phosphate cytidylyltransferase
MNESRESASSGAEGPSGLSPAVVSVAEGQSGRIWGILVAAGSGTRFGGAKQYEVIGGKTVLQWSLDLLESVCDGVVVVLPEADAADWSGPQVAVGGGSTRSASVRAGLTRVPDDVDVVLVHDAARPFATPDLGRLVIKAIEAGADAAIPGVPVSDTIKRVDTATMQVQGTVDRSDLYAVQTPQAFRSASLRGAHEQEPNATDDAAVVESAGGKVVIVPGEATNMKITVAHDLAVAHVLIGHQQ